MRERRLFSRWDLVLLGGLVLLCALGFLLSSRSPQGTAAVVERKGQVLLRQELSQLDGPREAVIQGENGLSLTVELSPDGAAVLSAGCQDQVCVRRGKLTKAGETAVCLPAGISLRLEGPASPDAETY